MYPLGTKILVNDKPAIYIYKSSESAAVIRYSHEKDTRVVPARKIRLQPS